MTDKERLDMIEKARFHIFLKHPFLGYALQHYEISLRDDIQTAATDGISIFFSRSYLDTLSFHETIFVLLHELLHIVLNHIYRKGKRDHLKFNVACDIVINDMIKHYGFDEGNIKPIFGKAFQVNGLVQSAEVIYDKLPKLIDVTILDSHILWDDENKEATIKIKSIIDKAEKEGYSLGLGHRIEREIKTIKSKPVKTLKDVLEPILEAYVKDYTYDRTDRRFSDVLLPDYYDSYQVLKNIWFLVDVSGSMDKNDISAIYGNLLYLIKSYDEIKADVSFFSTEVTKPISFHNVETLKHAFNHIQSTGGTDFRCIFEALEIHYKYDKPIALVIITDGYGNFPEKKKHPVKVIWGITSEHDKAPFGETIYIKGGNK